MGDGHVCSRSLTVRQNVTERHSGENNFEGAAGTMGENGLKIVIWVKNVTTLK